ncbi:hypothetical protein [Plantactinospora sp. B5E13]|uniref:hypothetical protein n=1 Tax=unclassified Plantactinospora TaxID=2631981 RepID=UPI00325F2EF9
MAVVDGPSAWAIERFGFTLAVQLWRRVPAAMHRAVERARDARDASEMTSDHAFGSVRWLVQYEELLNHLEGLPETVSVRPPRAQFRITICAGHLLLPWRYSAKSDVPMDFVRPNRTFSRFARDLLRLFGPEPRFTQDPLPLMPPHPEHDRDLSELRGAVEDLTLEPKVLSIPWSPSGATRRRNAYRQPSC